MWQVIQCMWHIRCLAEAVRSIVWASEVRAAYLAILFCKSLFDSALISSLHCGSHLFYNTPADPVSTRAGTPIP